MSEPCSRLLTGVGLQKFVRPGHQLLNQPTHHVNLLKHKTVNTADIRDSRPLRQSLDMIGRGIGQCNRLKVIIISSQGE